MVGFSHNANWEVCGAFLVIRADWYCVCDADTVKQLHVKKTGLFIMCSNILCIVALEEVGHDAHLCYSHMTLVCTSWCYAFRRK